MPNKTTQEVRAAARRLVEDPVYCERLQRDLRLRKVAPVVEQMLWHYAFGRPEHLLRVDTATTTKMIQVIAPGAVVPVAPSVPDT